MTCSPFVAGWLRAIDLLWVVPSLIPSWCLAFSLIIPTDLLIVGTGAGVCVCVCSDARSNFQLQYFISHRRLANVYFPDSLSYVLNSCIRHGCLHMVCWVTYALYILYMCISKPIWGSDIVVHKSQYYACVFANHVASIYKIIIDIREYVWSRVLLIPAFSLATFAHVSFNPSYCII